MKSSMEPGALSAKKNANMWEEEGHSLASCPYGPPRGPPEGERLDGYRRVHRQDTKRIVSAVGDSLSVGPAPLHHPSRARRW